MFELILSSFESIGTSIIIRSIYWVDYSISGSCSKSSELSLTHTHYLYLLSLNRRSYMSALVLLNLLNELRKRDKITITLKSHFWRENVIILSLQRFYGRHNVSHKICKPPVVYRFYYMALLHSQTQRHMIKYHNTPL